MKCKNYLLSLLENIPLWYEDVHTRIDKKNRKKQNLKTYGFIAFIIIAFILLFNLI